MKTPTEIKAEIEERIKAFEKFNSKGSSNLFQSLNQKHCIDKEKAKLSGLILAWENELEFLEAEKKRLIRVMEFIANFMEKHISKEDFEKFPHSSKGYGSEIEDRIKELKQVLGEKT